MSETAHIDIEYIARLSRLTLTDKEKELFSSQLEDILQHFEKLNEIDVSGEEAMAHPFPVFNVLGEDEPSETFTPEVALANAPKQRDNQLVVPKVVDDA